MPEDIWMPLFFLVGNWTGTGHGQSGNSEVKRSYQFVLNGRFLEVRSQSVYPTQEKNPKGEVHEEFGLFSHDRARSQFVLRQFHVEGFVNQYVLDSRSDDGQTMTFATEFIENIPAGWRARETYRVLGADEFVETFELAPPNGEFELYAENHLRR